MRFRSERSLLTRAQVQTASKEDVDDAVKAARHCFETAWSTEVSSQLRGQLLFKLADGMEAAMEELAKLEYLDSGKPLAWCKADIEDSVACLRYYAGESRATRHCFCAKYNCRRGRQDTRISDRA